MKTRKALAQAMHELPNKLLGFQDNSTPDDLLAGIESTVSFETLLSLTKAMAQDPEKTQPLLLEFLLDRWNYLEQTKIFTIDYQYSRVNQACSLVVSTLNKHIEDNIPIFETYLEFEYRARDDHSTDSKEQQHKSFDFLVKYLFDKPHEKFIMQKIPVSKWQYLLENALLSVSGRKTFFTFMATQVERGSWTTLLGSMTTLDLCFRLWSSVFSQFCTDFTGDQQQFAIEMYGQAGVQFDFMASHPKGLLSQLEHYSQEEIRAFVFTCSFLYEKLRDNQGNYKSATARIFSYSPIFNNIAYTRKQKIDSSIIFRRFVSEHSSWDNLSYYLKETGQGMHMGPLTEPGSTLAALVNLYKAAMQQSAPAMEPTVKESQRPASVL